MPNTSPWTQTFAGQPALGSHAERSRTTTMRDVELFTEMTGDRNPIHYDAELAAKSSFGGLIVQGGVTTGLLNAVVAEDLPGPGTVFLETNWRFLKAVRVGETITASVKVEHVREDKPICRLETLVRTADGKTCVAGTATTYTMPLLERETGDANDCDISWRQPFHHRPSHRCSLSLEDQPEKASGAKRQVKTAAEIIK